MPAVEKNEPNFLSPYWAKVWPAAIGLCDFLERNKQLTRNKNILELAAGLGLPGIFVAQYAGHVTISDIEPAAVELARQSAFHNHLKNVDCRLIDWNNLEEVQIPEVLLLSDINYEPAQFELITEMIHYFLNKGAVIILSTPQRLMAKTFINRLLIHVGDQSEIMVDQDGLVTAVSIFILEQNR